jgi:hypothetical protein
MGYLLMHRILEYSPVCLFARPRVVPLQTLPIFSYFSHRQPRTASVTAASL